MRITVKAIVASTIAMVATLPSVATPQRVAGSGYGGYSQWATDHYPGFEGLDNLPVPEKKEKGWLTEWLGIGAPKGASPAEQLDVARKLEAEGEYKSAVKAYDALVREWPASVEAPEAQYRLAFVFETNLGEYGDAFEEYSYLLDFYPKSCAYAKIVEAQYKIVNLLHDTRRMFLGMSFTGNRELRQNYERIVRRAPGAAYVPEAMLKIADLREQDTDFEEAIKVYSTLRSRHPGTVEARRALYLEAKARMWLVRRLAYNLPRCKDTEGYLKLALRNDPSHPNAEEMRKWLSELSDYLAEDAWVRAKFYDTKQRTRHAAVAAYGKFLEEFPDSPHADEARARIAALKEDKSEGNTK
jgi:TolA-binding protein